MTTSTSTSETLCRIQGLTSSKGKRLNGLAASFDANALTRSDGRLAVTVDGVPSQFSIKPDNLYKLRRPVEDLGVGVGRSDLRSQKFMATVVDQRAGRRLSGKMLAADGTALRSRGTLLALHEYMQEATMPKGDVVINVTDLNVALLLNCYAMDKIKMEDVQLDSKQQALAVKVGKLIIRHKRSILFKYTPFRIKRGDHPADGRLEAVLNSQFHIYPCTGVDYLDALEVRFALPGKSTHEFFLDYGEDESIQYTRNAYSMQELDRLEPEILADVDPQMFWSFVLHSKALVKELKKLKVADILILAWSNIYSSYLKSIIAFKDALCSVNEAVRLLPDRKGRWNLINDKIHSNVATRNARVAIILSIDWAMQDDNPHSNHAIEIMDKCKGTEIGEVVSNFSSAMHSSDPQDLQIALHQMMAWKETKTCDHCGEKQKDMYDCARCKSAHYCGRDCQHEAWKSHKKVCKELQDAREPTQKEHVRTKMYDKDDFTSRQQPSLLVESCGLGYLNIFWWYGNESIQNALAFKSMKKDTIFKTEVSGSGGFSGTATEDLAGTLARWLKDADKAKTFLNDLSDLDPISRLCLACGPIPDMDVAKSTVDDALVQAHGDATNLKMPWVRFTPLEWAAKKGQIDIAQWLLSDARTSALVQVGSPVGWACYTNRVEIARLLIQHGASPNATDEVFWDSRPPILAAAENGMLNAVQFLAEECGISIATTWKGNGILQHVKMSPSWSERKGHRAVRKYAAKKLKAMRK